MRLHTHLASLVIFMAALISGWCGNGGPSPTPNLTPAESLKPAAPARLQVQTEKEVTFYPTYGYRAGTNWNAQLRGWVHEDREHRAEGVVKLLKLAAKCNDAEVTTVRSRSADFVDDNKTSERVLVKFDSDPEDRAYEFTRSSSDGIVRLDLVLTDDEAKRLLEQQKSPNGWLTFRAVSQDHTGLGRVRLIESDPNGISLISDIDDTIKATEVPAGKDTVLHNTFCLDFKSVVVPDMAAAYKALGDIPVHYVSGGPEQLFGPLYDFLITGPGAFPEGTFHLKFFSTHPSLESTNNLMKFLGSSLEVTYRHKLSEITELMNRFPERKFILVGDSGEIDPEVYNEIRKKRPAQVQEIRIRDLINDNAVNNFRLTGMTVIPVNPIVCVDDKHFEKLLEKMQEHHKEEYVRNPACPRS
ncbi:MAG TPA: phosphatase domain-containing protein [Pyrinomonadaceae bacterium]|nr:phosphatase domain-containing protein [Pyrinomonadaceae bacterium]